MDYSLLTYKELISYCKEQGIKGYSCKTKEYIINELLKIKDNNKKNISENEIKLKNKSEFKTPSVQTYINNKLKTSNLYDYLCTNYPELINKYYGPIDEMKNINKGTMKKYVWKCKNYDICQNTFEARPFDIYRQKRQTRYCKICKNKESTKLYQKYMLLKNGSILDKYPQIINVWSDTNLVKPNQLSPQSHTKVTLKCIRNPSHLEYNIAVFNIQDSNCINCPKCNINTSKTEIRIYSEFIPLFKEVYWQKKIMNYEADIVIEDIKLIIEVDGYPWHYNKNEKDLNKNNIFIKNGYNVLRIRDTKLLPIDCNNIVFEISKITYNDFNKILDWINTKYNLNLLHINTFCNDIMYKNILYNTINIPFEDSIEFLFPDSTKIWDYEKNKPFLPSQFTMGSHTEVWVKCSNNHSFKRPIKQIFRIRAKDKTKRIIECPDCCNTIKINRRPIIVNNIEYKSITECYTKLNIRKNSIYNTIKKRNLDINDINVISDIIIEIYNNILNSS